MQPLMPYIPMDRRQAMANGIELPIRTHGAALFADISGFTPLANSLAELYGPQLGPEELTRQLNRVYEVLIHQVHRFRGSVIGFVGDAITCWFDADNGLRAATCAVAMQDVMREYTQVSIPGHATVTLSIKIGIAAGLVHRYRVGDPDIQLIDVLAGDTLQRMSLAEGAANKGEIVLDRLTAQTLEKHLEIAGWRSHPLAGGRFALLAAITTPVAPAPWPIILDDALDGSAIRPWVLPPICSRLQSGQEQFLAELRPAVSLFLKFSGLDYDADPAAGEKLDAYIRWVQRTAQRYEGNLIQLTIGDKGSFLYIAFGAPIAHDDDALRATRAALDLIAPPPALHFITGTQIGIAQGQARTGEYGSSTRRSYGVIGDDAVLAARLMAAAPPGEIRCAHSIWRAAAHRIHFEMLLPVRVKGRAELIRVYRPEGTRDARISNDAPAEDLFGREAEIARLTGILRKVQRGGHHILVIEGDAGIGKSRLVDALTRLIEEQGYTYLYGAGQSIERQTPYRAWRSVFNFYFALDPALHTEGNHQKIVTTLQQMVPDQLPYAALLNDVLHVDLPSDTKTSALEPAVRQQMLWRLLTDLLLAWAKDTPLFLILDDAHWLDNLTWHLLDHVAHTLAAASAPFLIAVVTRPLDLDNATVQHLQRLNAERLLLKTLDNAAIESLVTARLRLPSGHLPPALSRLITTRAEGNPFFAEELAFALRDRGVISLQHEDNATHCTVKGNLDGDAQTLPDTIHGLILSRIDQLPAEQQLTLKVAAVIGRTFAYHLLNTVMQRHTPVSDATLRAHLHALHALDLTPLARVEPLTYIFKHIITQEAAYQTLLHAQRRDLHRTVAATIEAISLDRSDDYTEILAYHWEHAGEIDKALGFVIRAGQRARRAYANEEAIIHFQHALHLVDAHSVNSAAQMEFEAWHGLGQTYFSIPDMGQAETCFRNAIALSETLAVDTGDRVRLYYWLGETIWWQNRAADQVEVGMRALALLGDDPAPSEALALANQTVAVGHIALDGMDKFIAYTNRTAEFLAQLPYSEELRSAYVHVIVVCQETGDVDGAFRWLRLLDECATRHGDLRAVAESHYLTGNMLADIGRHKETLDRYRQALDLYTQIRDMKFQVWCLKALGTTLYTLGELQTAAEYAGHAYSLAVAAGDNKFLIGETCWLNGIIALARGDVDSAQTHLSCAMRIFREVSSDQAQISTGQHLGTTRLAAGNRPAALKWFQRTLWRTQPVAHILHIPAIIGRLETTYKNPRAFRAFCDRYRTQHPGVNDTLFHQWFLEPTQPQRDFEFPIDELPFDADEVQNPKSGTINPSWSWIDPLGDCSYARQNGLIICAANGHALSKSNHTAPRLIRPVSGNFAVQTMCEPAFPIEQCPATGGLLVWKDSGCFLRLEYCHLGADEFLFSGNLNGKPEILGRGRLPEHGDPRVFLRLERVGGYVRALCSADGARWFTVGQIQFTAADPIQAGIFAIGTIDRTAFRRPYREGTAMRFTSLQLWATISEM